MLINKKTKTITATSILRDVYLQIPSKKNNRVNAAHAMETLFTCHSSLVHHIQKATYKGKDFILFANPKLLFKKRIE